MDFFQSDSVDEAIKTVFYFNEEILHAQNAYKRTKTKRQHFYAHKKHLRSRKSLIPLFAFCVFYAFYAFCACKNFSLKKIK